MSWNITCGNHLWSFLFQIIQFQGLMLFCLWFWPLQTSFSSELFQSNRTGIPLLDSTEIVGAMISRLTSHFHESVGIYRGISIAKRQSINFLIQAVIKLWIKFSSLTYVIIPFKQKKIRLSISDLMSSVEVKKGPELNFKS